MPPGGAVVFGHSGLCGGNGVVYYLGMEPCRVEGLGVGGPLTTHKQYSVSLRSVLVLSTSSFMTSGSPAWKQLARAPKEAWLDLMMTNKLSTVLYVIPCRPLKRRLARLLYSCMISPGLLLRAYSAKTLSESASFPLGLYFSTIQPQILNPSCSYMGL